jgi:alpha-amylase
MANDGTHSDSLNYPRFSARDFHPHICIDNYDDRYQATHGWLGCNLPDLDTSSQYVRNEAKKYLTHLLDLGADGFRIDALKNIEEDYFRDVLSVVPEDVYLYGELISGNPNQAYMYTGIHGIDVTDYSLLNNLKGAFAPGGDLRSLISPQNVIRSENAVTFSKTHDTIPDNGKCEGLCQGYNFDSRDQMLANAYLLVRAEGMPLMFRDDASDPIVKGGANFHEEMMGKPQYFRNGNEIATGADSPNLLFIERGNEGIAIINKSGNTFDVADAKMPGLDVGCYQELHYNFPMSVSVGGDGQKHITRWGNNERGGISIQPRDAMFFVKTSDNICVL